VADHGQVEVRLVDFEYQLEISVCDNGIGIPQNEFEKVFEDFYRGSNVKASEYEGAGLGLSAVKQIIEKHSGKIAVKSPSEIGTDENPGTCFTIILPLAG
jgi:signal transduction histidine kinase